MTDIDLENLKRQNELNAEAIRRIEKSIELLTPKDLQIAVMENHQVVTEAKKRNTTNDLAWAYVSLFGLIVVAVYITTTVMIVNGYAEQLEKIEKLNFVVLGGGMTLMGYLGGYYFNSRENK